MKAVESNSTPPPAVSQSPSTSKSTARENYLKSKESEKVRKRLEKMIASTEDEIGRYEVALKDLEEKMSEGDTSAKILKEYQDNSALLEAAMQKWEEAQAELEKILQ